MQTEECVTPGKLPRTTLKGHSVVHGNAPNCITENPSKICAGCKSAVYCSGSCQKKHWDSHKHICKAIQLIEVRKEQTHGVDVNDIKGSVYELSPKSKQKLAKLIGEKCTLNVLLNQTECEVLWDTGAQVSIVSKDWLIKQFPMIQVRSVQDLFEGELVISAANENLIDFEGWSPISLQLDKEY